MCDIVVLNLYMCCWIGVLWVLFNIKKANVTLLWTQQAPNDQDIALEEDKENGCTSIFEKVRLQSVLVYALVLYTYQEIERMRFKIHSQ